MGWLRRFERKGGTDISSQTVGEIRHGQWSREAGTGGTLLEDMFVNPDPSSPIAGILITRYASKDLSHRKLDIEAICHDGRGDEGAALLEKNGLGSGVFSGVHEITLEGMRSLGVKPAYMNSTLIIDLSGRDLAEPDTQEFYRVGVGKIMDTLLNKKIISNDPALRQVFVDKIREKFHSAQVSSEPSHTRLLKGQ